MQSRRIFAQSHNRETVTFRNSAFFHISMVNNLCLFRYQASCLLSRPSGLHGLAPSVSRILKLPLFLLFQNNFFETCSLKVFLKGVPPRQTGWFFWILPRVCLGAQGIMRLVYISFCQYLFIETLWKIYFHRRKMLLDLIFYCNLFENLSPVFWIHTEI